MTTNPQLPASALLPFLGQPVLFYDPYLVQSPGERHPRFALITGLGERPGVVHLTVFNHPQEDVASQGMGPVQARARVEFIARGEKRPGPTVAYCTPADDRVPASMALGGMPADGLVIGSGEVLHVIEPSGDVRTICPPPPAPAPAPPPAAPLGPSPRRLGPKGGRRPRAA